MQEFLNTGEAFEYAGRTFRRVRNPGVKMGHGCARHCDLVEGIARESHCQGVRYKACQDFRDVGCGTGFRVFKEIDPLYLDLLKAKEKSDEEANKSD
jgi:hypothetical protein